MLTKEDLKKHTDDFIAKHKEVINEIVTEEGYCIPQIFVFGYHKKEDKCLAIVMPVPEQIIQSAEAKADLAKRFPEVLYTMEFNAGIVPLCFVFTSEAWIRTTPIEGTIEDTINNVDINSLPKTEAIFNYFETDESSELNYIYITRTGKKVHNKEGKEVDEIVLTPMDIEDGKPANISGNFHGIMTKYKKYKAERRANVN